MRGRFKRRRIKKYRLISSKKTHRVKRRRAKPRARNNTLPATALLSRDLHARYKINTFWMILELNDEGESLYDKYELLESELIRIFGENTPFFIPCHIEKVKDKIVGMDLIGGYVFVEKTTDSESSAVIMSSPYIKGRMPEGSRPGSITGRDINEYKSKLRNKIKSLAPKKGSLVVPKIGTFKDMEGKVISVSKDRMTATVVFKRASRIVQAPVSVLNMDPAISVSTTTGTRPVACN